MEESAPSEPADADSTAGTPWARIALGAVGLVAVLWLARVAGGYVPALASWVEAQGAWGPALYIVAYVIATVAFIPGALITLAGGAIFGLVEGTLYVFTGAVLGSGSAFLVARYVAREWVEHRIERNARFAAVDRAVAENGLKITFLLRLSPVFPFNFINYALGLTRVSFRDYMLAAVGMLPGTVLYVYYGRVIGDVAALASGAAPERTTASYAVTALGLVATVAVTTVATRIARKALAEVDESGTRS